MVLVVLLATDDVREEEEEGAESLVVVVVVGAIGDVLVLVVAAGRGLDERGSSPPRNADRRVVEDIIVCVFRCFFVLASSFFSCRAFRFSV